MPDFEKHFEIAQIEYYNDLRELNQITKDFDKKVEDLLFEDFSIFNKSEFPTKKCTLLRTRRLKKYD
ncbi:hypothetical protein GVAV_001387 [Gurleya vavrai]